MIERRKICIDDSRSHTTGLLPYILYDSANTQDQFVGPDDMSGNWGNFPLDLAMAKMVEESNELLPGISSRSLVLYKNTELDEDSTEEYENYADRSRMKYHDIMLRYNEIQKILDSSIYGKGVLKNIEVSGKTTCSTNNSTCEYDVPEPNTVEKVVLASGVLGETGRYEFIPMHESAFTTSDSRIYVPIDDEESPVELEEDKYYVILSDYDKVFENEGWWKNWWELNGELNGKTWQELFPLDEENDFNFCRVVEKYIIGKAEVPQSIEGIKVPQYVYYANIPNLKKWFDDNGVTTSADTEGKEDKIVKEFEERGGEEFYNFLKGIEEGWATASPWITSVMEPNADEYQATYITPYISTPVSLYNEYEFEGLYEPYIYSYDEETDSFYEDYATYSAESLSVWYVPESAVVVESKLASVIDEDATEINNVTGTWAELPEDVDKTNLFKCTFFTENSSTTGEGITRKTTYSDGRTPTTATTGTPEVAALTRTDLDRIVIQNIIDVSPANRTETTESVIEDDVTATTVSTTGYTVYRYEWWECTRQTEEEAKNIPCADGEDVSKNQDKYRTVSILECFKDMVDGTVSNNNYYYFMIKKDNGYIYHGQGVPVTMSPDGLQSFKIPYTNGSFHHMEETDNEGIYHGNYITDIKIEDSAWTIQYVIGGLARSNDSGKTFTAIDETGVKYEEEYEYKPGAKMYTFIDGHENVLVYYDKLNMEDVKTTIYNEEYGLYRDVNTARIIGMEIGSYFTSGTSIYAKLFTRDGTDAFSEDPKKIINISMDRGSAAAFERHFKLGECNTFEDLKNYGNNFYNLD